MTLFGLVRGTSSLLLTPHIVYEQEPASYDLPNFTMNHLTAHTRFLIAAQLILLANSP
jgi:hypothetical protein